MEIRKDRTVNTVAYALATLGVCVADAKGWHGLEYLCKPLLMIILSCWFYFSSRRVGDRFTLLVQVGLFFSLVGDVALMFQHVDDFNFLIGLGAFFLAQLCYAMSFGQNVFDIGGGEGLLVSILLSFGIVVYSIFFAWDLVPRVDDGLALPVIAYAAALALMGIMAAFRYTRTFLSSFWLIFVGALFFITSDSLLAINRFKHPFAGASVLIMVTYAVAQYLIVSGALTHVLDPDNLRRKAAMTT